jgi:hypothetical protein
MLVDATETNADGQGVFLRGLGFSLCQWLALLDLLFVRISDCRAASVQQLEAFESMEIGAGRPGEPC